jgi:hypothetical protein
MRFEEKLIYAQKRCQRQMNEKYKSISLIWGSLDGLSQQVYC